MIALYHYACNIISLAYNQALQFSLSAERTLQLLQDISSLCRFRSVDPAGFGHSATAFTEHLRSEHAILSESSLHSEQFALILFKYQLKSVVCLIASVLAPSPLTKFLGSGPGLAAASPINLWSRISHLLTLFDPQRNVPYAQTTWFIKARLFHTAYDTFGISHFLHTKHRAPRSEGN